MSQYEKNDFDVEFHGTILLKSSMMTDMNFLKIFSSVDFGIGKTLNETLPESASPLLYISTKSKKEISNVKI